MAAEPVETFVFLPYAKYKALDTRAKRVEQDPAPSIPEGHPSNEEETSASSNPSITMPPPAEVKNPLGKDLTKHYRGVQIKKILRLIEKTKGSTEINSLANLEELIKSAVTNTKKKLPNEEVFFTFLFDNGLGHYVKNRSKIGLYYKNEPWYLL